MSTAFAKKTEDLFQALRQLHKYRQSNPVHGNELISVPIRCRALKTRSPCWTRTPEEPEEPADDAVEPATAHGQAGDASRPP
jgi:hypothetical protein